MSEGVESVGRTLNQGREREEGDDDKIWIYAGKVHRQTRLWKRGGTRQRIFKSEEIHRIEPECVGAISPTAKLHSSDVSQPWQTYAQLSGYSRDSATNGNKERQLLTNVYFSPFHPFHRLLFSPYCKHYFSLLVIQLFFSAKLNSFWHFPVTQSFVFNKFECLSPYGTAWLVDWFIADLKLGELCLFIYFFLHSTNDVRVYFKRENFEHIPFY